MGTGNNSAELHRHADAQMTLMIGASEGEVAWLLQQAWSAIDVKCDCRYMGQAAALVADDARQSTDSNTSTSSRDPNTAATHFAGDCAQLPQAALTCIPNADVKHAAPH